MWLLIYIFLFICTIIATVFSSSYFRQIPATVSLGLPSATTLTYVTDLSDCGLIGEDESIVAIQLYVNGTCLGFTMVQGYTAVNVNDTVNLTYSYYVRVDGSNCDTCASSSQALHSIMELTFFNSLCPNLYNATLDPPSQYCFYERAAETSQYYYGSHFKRYRVGVMNNMTLYMMSRGQVSQTLKYSCGYWDAFVLTYNNLFYCVFNVKMTMSSNNVKPIVQNYCLDYLANSWPTKFFHQLIPGMIYIYTSAAMANIYLNGANWVYYDNTTVSSLDWATGFPTGDGQIVVINQDLSISNSRSNNRGYLSCIAAAVLS